MMGKSYMPNAGLVWNPLREYPRNSICPCCDSGKKFKQCHEGKLPACIKPELAEKVRALMDKVKDE